MLANLQLTYLLSQTGIMEQYFLKVLVFLSITVTYVAGERICIVASQNQPCAASCSSNESCLTLNQYFLREYTRNTSDPSPSNIILELLPGTHSLWLDSVPDYRISSKDSVEIRSDNATIICNNSATNYIIYYRNISSVLISGIKFIDCRDLFWVDVLSIEDSIFQRHYSLSTVETSLVNITRTLFINGFTLDISSSTLLIKLSTFINVTTGPHSIPCGDGGAINFRGHTIIVEETTFVNNSAIGTYCSRPTDEQGSGGAMHLRLYYSGPNLKVKISSCNFDHNSATFSGGALFVYGGSLEISNSSFSSSWGGMYAGALYYIHGTSAAKISNSNFTDNIAGMKGGAMYISSSYSYFLVSLSKSIFSYNSVRDQSGEGGAFTYTNSFGRSSYISIFKSKFIQNTAPGNAGALYIIDAPTLVINESSFALNRASGSGGVIHISSDYHIAIAIHQSSFMNNQADEDGGVIYVKSNAIPYVSSQRRNESLIKIDNESNFTFNVAVRSGGIITMYCRRGQLDISTAQICCTNIANLGGIIKVCSLNRYRSGDYIDIMTQEELFKRRDPTERQCTLYDSLYANTSSITTQAPQQPTPTIMLCDNTSIHRENIFLSLFILFLVLVLILSTILMYVALYLCGVFKHKVGTNSDVTDRCVYVPMNESETT